MKALELLTTSAELVDRLADNTRYFRNAIQQTGLNVLPGDHPITPIMLGDAALSQKMAQRMPEEGVYVTGFFFRRS